MNKVKLENYATMIIVTISILALMITLSMAIGVGIDKQIAYEDSVNDAKVDCVLDQAITNVYEIAYVCEVPLEFVVNLQDE